MGSINLKHTGSGSAIALSSDGTSLLLDGTAIGGGGGGADLYTANESSPTAQPSATGTNAIAIGDSAISSNTNSIAFGKARSRGISSFAALIDNNTTTYGATNNRGIAIGKFASAGTGSVCIGYGGWAGGSHSYAIGESSSNQSFGRTYSFGYSIFASAANQVNIAGASQDVRISEAYTIPKVDGSANEVLTTDGSGTVSWAAAGGGASNINGLSDGKTSTTNYGLGTNSINALTTGGRNHGFGEDSLKAVTEGSNNVAIGYRAGDAITTGSQNIMIGTHCDGSTSGTARIAIGYDMTVNSDNRVQIGSGNSNQIFNNFASNASWTRPSDERLKEDIQTNTSCGLDFINELRTVTYKWKDKSAYDKKMYGLIAQEVKSSLDSKNITDFGGWSLSDEGDATSTQAVAYEMFVIPLIKSVQELKAKNDALEARITALET